MVRRTGPYHTGFMVKDLKFKKIIVELGLDSKLRSLRREVYKHYGILEYLNHNPDLEIALDCLSDFESSIDSDLLRVCYNLNRSFYRRRKLCSDRIKFMLENGNCLFLTFTFTDDKLDSTSFDYRRKSVARYLADYNTLYVANIDFGVKDEYVDKLGVSRKGTHREHYHAVIMCDEVDYSNWQFGALNGLKVRKLEDHVAIATYMNKLTNHAFKSSTLSVEDYFKSRVIYSKKWKEVVL